IIEMEPDIENMTMSEYLEYEAWDIMVEDVERLKKLLTPSIHTLPEPDLVVQSCVPLLPSPDEAKVVRDEEPNNDDDSISIHVPDVMDDVIQPSIPQVIHTTPPDKDYVAPATKSILDELLEESEPFIHVTFRIFRSFYDSNYSIIYF
ncbi:hypothetical protein Tco_0843885, partial [Tanacetum coccineum]